MSVRFGCGKKSISVCTPRGMSTLPLLKFMRSCDTFIQLENNVRYLNDKVRVLHLLWVRLTSSSVSITEPNQIAELADGIRFTRDDDDDND